MSEAQGKLSEVIAQQKLEDEKFWKWADESKAFAANQEPKLRTWDELPKLNKTYLPLYRYPKYVQWATSGGILLLVTLGQSQWTSRIPISDLVIQAIAFCFLPVIVYILWLRAFLRKNLTISEEGVCERVRGKDGPIIPWSDVKLTLRPKELHEKEFQAVISTAGRKLAETPFSVDDFNVGNYGVRQVMKRAGELSIPFETSVPEPKNPIAPLVVSFAAAAAGALVLFGFFGDQGKSTVLPFFASYALGTSIVSIGRLFWLYFSRGTQRQEWERRIRDLRSQLKQYRGSLPYSADYPRDTLGR